MLTTLIYLLLAAFAGLGLLLLMIRWEAEGRSGRSVALVLGVALLEALVQRASTNVPIGIWRIPLGPLDVRPIDLLLPMALTARLLVRTQIAHISRFALTWLLFYVWYTVGAYWGYVQNNDTARLVNQFRGISLIIGVMILVGGLKPSTAALEKANRHIGKVALAAALFVYGFRFTVGHIAFDVPLIGAPQLGIISAEASLILACLGIYVLMHQLMSSERELMSATGGVLLVLNPLLQTQAASIVAVGMMLGALAVVSLTNSWRSRIKVTGTELTLFAVAAVGIGLMGQVVVGEELELVDSFEQALFSDAQGRTTEIRRILWADAVGLVQESPLIGQGVGHLLDVPARWPDEAGQAASHNVTLDIALRSGLPGLILFVGALAVTFITCWKRWLELDGVHAAALLSAFLALVAILTKGQVESALDQFRQATAFGVAVGIVLVYARHDPDDGAVDLDEDVESLPARATGR